jgi:hypothetical protein
MASDGNNALGSLPLTISFQRLDNEPGVHPLKMMAAKRSNALNETCIEPTTTLSNCGIANESEQLCTEKKTRNAHVQYNESQRTYCMVNTGIWMRCIVV